jgi:hypothetical protein
LLRVLGAPLPRVVAGEQVFERRIGEERDFSFEQTGLDLLSLAG